MRYYIVSLGCPKNTVDAQDMILLLQEAGHQIVADPEQADVLMVNTCGFIEPARAESLQALNDLARQKRPDQKLIATGCWAQRAGRALARQVNGLDAILGTRRWSEIVSVVENLERQKAITLVGDPPAGEPADLPRVAIQGKSAYLKIADGCSAFCAFCAIPLIKGPAQSRPVHDILSDARSLAEQGVREIILIAQDTTAYGRDRGEQDALPALLEEIIKTVPDVPWIRLMYAYPQHISQRLVETMAKHPQICHYLDLPLQHAHPATLKRMHRPPDINRVRHLIRMLRQHMPDIALRTSFIIGYPGETENEFRALVAFLSEIQFDKVGVFIYSPEEGTAAYSLANSVPEDVKLKRYDHLMRLQQSISLARNQVQIGRTVDVLIEGTGEAELEDPEQEPIPISIGRSYRDAPEIDGLVLVEGNLEPGQMVPIRITEAMEYDLMGVLEG